MMMNQSLMEIQVHGFTGDGKTHVCEVIEKALQEAYGYKHRILNFEDTDSENKPKKNVVFTIREFNHGSLGTHKSD